MGNLWKAGQIGTRVLAGAAGSIFGPAGAAIGAGVVGPMIADLAFGPGQMKEKELYNWNEPTSFASYQDKPENRLGVTTTQEDPNVKFKGALKTADTIAGTLGSFLPGNWGKNPDIGDKLAGKVGNLFKKSSGNMAGGGTQNQATGAPLRDTPWDNAIQKWAGKTQQSLNEFNGIFNGIPYAPQEDWSDMTTPFGNNENPYWRSNDNPMMGNFNF